MYPTSTEYRIEQRAKKLQKNPLIKFFRKIVYLAMIPVVFIEHHAKNTISLMATIGVPFAVITSSIA